MALGNEAKEKIINKIIAALQDSYIACHDKKYYFWSEENGQKVQIAITLTCPKSMISVDTTADSGGDWDFSDTPKASG